MPKDFNKQIDSAAQQRTTQLRSRAAKAEERARTAERKLASARKRVERDVQGGRERLTAARIREQELKRECRRLSRQLEQVNGQVAELADQTTRMQHRSKALGEHVRRLTDDHHTATDLFEHAHREIARNRREVKMIQSEAAVQRMAFQEQLADLQARYDGAMVELAKRDGAQVGDRR